MVDTSPAEMMLDSLVPAQRLIERLQAVLKAPVPYVGIDLSHSTKAKIAAFQVSLQGHIDELTAQREEAAALVQQIPDQTARKVLLMHYGLTEPGRKMSYEKIETELNYCSQTIYRYRKVGIEQLNQILESGS